MSFLVAICSGQCADDGVLLHIRQYDEAFRFAEDWQRRHPADRLTILTNHLEPLTSLDPLQPGSAQPGNRASEAQS
jgi:hypothetical protein